MDSATGPSIEAARYRLAAVIRSINGISRVLVPADRFAARSKHLAASGDVLTPAEVAELLQIGRAAAVRAMTLGQIPSFRIGRQVRVTKTTLMNRFFTGQGRSEE